MSQLTNKTDIVSEIRKSSKNGIVACVKWSNSSEVKTYFAAAGVLKFIKENQIRFVLISIFFVL